MKFGIIGAGVVGTAMAVRLEAAGYQCLGVSTRSDRSYERFRRYLNKERLPLEEWIPEADLVWITTQDGMIRSVAENLVQQKLYKSGQIWIHCSGSQSSRILKPQGEIPIKALSIHPLQAFADVEEALQLLPGTHFGIEGEAEEIGIQIVQALGGFAHRLDPDKKPLYHAGAVVASNYLVTLASLAVHLFDCAGIKQEEALKSLLPLMQGTLRNLANIGLPQALTGPIARGDSEVVRSHLEHMPLEMLEAYQALGLSTLELAQAKMEQKGEEYPKEALKSLNRLLAPFEERTESSHGNC